MLVAYCIRCAIPVNTLYLYYNQTQCRSIRDIVIWNLQDGFGPKTIMLGFGLKTQPALFQTLNWHYFKMGLKFSNCLLFPTEHFIRIPFGYARNCSQMINLTNTVTHGQSVINTIQQYTVQFIIWFQLNSNTPVFSFYFQPKSMPTILYSLLLCGRKNCLSLFNTPGSIVGWARPLLDDRHFPSPTTCLSGFDCRRRWSTHMQ